MSNNTSLAFGSGVLIGTTSAGPLQFGTLQDVSVDFSFSLKSLMGQYQFPVAVARGAGKISGKEKSPNFDANLGVAYASSGLQLTPVASSPAAGQYSVASGVYTFSSADAGKAVLITYSYTQSVAGSNAVIS